jgi:hypothetical protein
MVTEISYRHFCNLGALCNHGCFSRYDDKMKRMQYYYCGDLSRACWMGYNIRSPGDETERKEKTCQK